MAIHKKDVDALCDALSRLGVSMPTLEDCVAAAESIADRDLSRMLRLFALKAGVKARLLAKARHEMEKRAEAKEKSEVQLNG